MWTEEKLGRVSRIISGVAFPYEAQGQSSGDIPFVKVSDLSRPSNMAGIRDAANWVTTAQAAALGVRIVPAGAVVFPKVGAALLGNARALTLIPVAMDNNLMAVAPRDGEPAFWRYLLMTVDLGELSPGGPLPYVSESQVRELRLRVPERSRQLRIARHLEQKLANHDAAVAALVEVRGAALERRMLLMLKEVVGDPADGEGRAFDLAWAPAGKTAWPTVKLTHVARLGSGHTPSRSRPDWWTDCHIPWITTGEVQQVRDDRREVITETRERISALGLANSAAALHPRGTVVLSRTASVGFSAVMGADMTTSQDFATWTCGPKVDPFYLLYCLRAMRPYLLGYLAQGSTHKTIYMPDIEALRIPLPDIQEQRTIVRRIRQQVGLVDELVDSAHGQLRLLHERRQALIAAAVTGQLDLSGEAAA